MAQEADCDGMRDLLGAAAEGELGPDALAEVTAHVAHCVACAQELRAITDLRRELSALSRPAAPPHLAETIRRALPPPPGMARGRRRWLELAAASVAGMAVGAGAMRLAMPAGADALHDAFAAHARALLAGLPLQVASADSHTVRPWLSGRLPWSTRVAEPDGFPLQGARLDLLGGQVVAALVYRRRAHVVTVFVAPADLTPGWPAGLRAERGLRALSWQAEGVRYMAVSEIGEAELRLLAGALGG